MRQTKDFSLNYTLLIICEGDKSEPYFYEGLLSLLNQKVGKRQFEYTIYPFPVGEEKTDAQNGRARRELAIKDSDEPLPEIKVKGPQPVCWVEAGKDQLGIFSEVWVVYDHDGRLHNADAHNMILEERDKGLNLHLAFSSRCFEMYLLEHHEYCYRAFEKSECNEKQHGNTHYFKCMLPEAEAGACHGERCINGYARQRGYWQYSKTNKVFGNVTNLWYGIYNSHKLKWQSLAIEEPSKEMYDRNPYLNTYRLTARLMDVNILEYGDQVIVNKGQRHEHIMYREGNIIHFENHSVLPLKMDGVLRVYQIDKNLPDIEEKLVDQYNLEPLKLEAGETSQYDLTQYLGDDCYLKFTWEGKEHFCALEDTVSPELDLKRFRVS
jgi:hypothetical protein